MSARLWAAGQLLGLFSQAAAAQMPRRSIVREVGAARRAGRVAGVSTCLLSRGQGGSECLGGLVLSGGRGACLAPRAAGTSAGRLAQRGGISCATILAWTRTFHHRCLPSLGKLSML